MFTFLRNLKKIKINSEDFIYEDIEFASYDTFNIIQNGKNRAYYLKSSYSSKFSHQIYIPNSYLIQGGIYKKFLDTYSYEDVMFTVEQSIIVDNIESYDDTELLMHFGKRYTDKILINSYENFNSIYDFITKERDNECLI